MKMKPMHRNNLVYNYIFALISVIVIASILILIQGSDPLEAFSALIKGAIGNKSAIASSVRWSIPIIISSMAAVVAHRSGINNLGLDGQIYFGALASALVGAFIPMPSIIHVFVCILIGGLAGSLFALIPALLNVIFNINEMVVTLMFNYIAVLVTEYITLQVMGFGASTNPDQIATPEIQKTASLSKIMPPYQASTGIFIAIFIAFLVFLFYKYSVKGYEWKMLGNNKKFAHYGGVNYKLSYLIVFMTSAFLAGIVGTIEILGPHQRFRVNFAQNLGWDGIMVALIAKNNPVAAFIFSFIWGMIKAGSLAMERTTSVNRIIVTLVQAIFVLFVTVDFRQLYLKIKDSIRENRAKREEKLV